VKNYLLILSFVRLSLAVQSFVILSLVIFSFNGLAQELIKIKALSGKVSILAPKGFGAMPSDILAVIPVTLGNAGI